LSGNGKFGRAGFATSRSSAQVPFARDAFELLQAVIDEYRLHYNDERPHRSRNLRPPASRSDRMQVDGGQIERRTRLGGLPSDCCQLPVAA